MKRFVCSKLPLLVLLALAASAFAQPNANPPKCYLVLLKRPFHVPQLSKQASEKLQEEHMANIRKLHSEHKLLLAGPFTDHTSFRGIFVLRADSLAQAQEWTSSDPAVRAGHLAPEVYGPWLIDGGLIHDPPATEGVEQYTLVLMKTGENWRSGTARFRNAMKHHEAFVKEMTKRGNMALAGLLPFNDPGELRGVEIFRVATQQALKLAERDPAVTSGLIKTEIHPWITSKGMLAPGQPVQ